MQSSQVFSFIFLIVFSSFGGWRLSNATRPPISKTITVSSSGGGDYTTVSDAIAKGVPDNNSQWILIHIRAGTYNEQVTIPETKPYIILEGENKESTTIEYNSSADIKAATISVDADNFVARFITFKNTYNHPTYPHNINDIPRLQAVAALVAGDMISFRHCGFVGVQDTLFDFSGRHLYKNCYIEGVVDFIFGNGQSVFQRCLINVTAGQGSGYITAHHRNNANDPSGFVFKFCKVFGSGTAYLGRAWGPYARVIYHKTELSNIISPEGWDAWGFQGHEENLTYAEDSCSGPGSDTSKRVPWEKKLSPAQINFLTGPMFNRADGWPRKQP